MISKAMIMTAGLGTRLRPFTDITTKALLPVMGVPCAQFAVDTLRAAGVKSFVANIHHRAKETQAGLHSLEWNDAKLDISDESLQILGSGGGIRNALSLLGNDAFYIANADVISDLDWHSLSAHHKKLRSKWGVSLTLAVFLAGPPKAFYREILFDSSEGLISALGGLCEGRPFYIGSAILERESLNYVPDSGTADFVQHILEPAIQKKKAGIFCTSGLWYDIGSPALWLETHLALMSRLETGEFASPGARIIQKRLEKSNVRKAERIWVNKKGSPRVTHWVGPCYWNGEACFPTQLGPNGVLYGDSHQIQKLQHGIGYGGKSWSDEL